MDFRRFFGTEVSMLLFKFLANALYSSASQLANNCSSTQLAAHQSGCGRSSDATSMPCHWTYLKKQILLLFRAPLELATEAQERKNQHTRFIVSRFTVPVLYRNRGLMRIKFWFWVSGWWLLLSCSAHQYLMQHKPTCFFLNPGQILLNCGTYVGYKICDWKLVG